GVNTVGTAPRAASLRSARCGCGDPPRTTNGGDVVLQATIEHRLQNVICKYETERSSRSQRLASSPTPRPGADRPQARETAPTWPNCHGFAAGPPSGILDLLDGDA